MPFALCTSGAPSWLDRKRMHDLGDGGGYVLASVHNILVEVPPENIVAMLETATMEMV